MTPQPAPPPPAFEALLRHFRSQRPLRAGSLLVTVFGDAVAPRGGAVTLGSLIRLGQPFGLTERLVRTSVARLAREGWLSARRSGRRSEYQLTASGAARFAEATQRIYGAAPAHWQGRWTLVLLRSAVRTPKARRELRWLGFGQLGSSLLAHPSCTPAQARAWLRRVTGARSALILQSTPGPLALARQLAARGWNLQELARRYRRFIARFAPLEAALQGRPPEPQVAFAVRTLLIHEYRKIHLQDPLLPAPLLPSGWVGSGAYDLCGRLYARVFAGAESYLSQTAHRLQRPLPAASRAAHARFGGVGDQEAAPAP